MDETKPSNSKAMNMPIDDNGMRLPFKTPDNLLVKKYANEAKYPWKSIRKGESFAILHSEMKKSSVAPFVSRMGKRHKKKFRITDMPEHGSYVISCIEAVPQNVIEALEQERK